MADAIARPDFSNGFSFDVKWKANRLVKGCFASSRDDTLDDHGFEPCLKTSRVHCVARWPTDFLTVSALSESGGTVTIKNG